MPKHFKLLYEYDYEDRWFPQQPVALTKARLFWDYRARAAFLQVKLFNVSDREIANVTLRVTALDAMQQIVASEELALPVTPTPPQREIVLPAPLRLSPPDIYGLRLAVATVSFGDGTLWQNEGDEAGAPLPPPRPLPRSHPAQVAAAANAVKPAYFFEEHAAFWRCCCGQANEPATRICCRCGRRREILRDLFATARPADTAAPLAKPRRPRRAPVAVLVVVLLVAAALMVWLLLQSGAAKRASAGTEEQPPSFPVSAPSQILDALTAGATFAPFLAEEEFIGHAVECFFGNTSYLAGLVYRRQEASDPLTPLVALLLLRQDGRRYVQVAKTPIESRYLGGFEEPLGSGYYGKTVIDGGDCVFIQTDEASFSEYKVLHQVLLDSNGLLDFDEYIGEDGAFIERDGAWYALLGNGYHQLLLDERAIRWQQASTSLFEDIEPAAADFVITLSHLEPTTMAMSFNVNGVPLNHEDFSADGPDYVYDEPLVIERGQSVYFENDPEVAVTAQFWDGDSGENLPVENGLGYLRLDSEDAPAVFYLYVSIFVDSGYLFTCQVQ